MIMNFATPLKIAEALACGVPVVTRNIIEYKLWYKHGVYTYSTYTELENLIKRLLNELDEVKAKLHNYSCSFRETFNWEKLAMRYENVLESVFNLNKK